MNPISLPARQPVMPQTPAYRPRLGGQGNWTLGNTGGAGQLSGNRMQDQPIPTDSHNTFILPDGTVVPWGQPSGQPPAGQGRLPQQNPFFNPQQFQQFQAQGQQQQLPGWAGYMRWLQMMQRQPIHPPPGITGGTPGPSRGG